MFILGYDEEKCINTTNPPVDYPKELFPSNGKLSHKAINVDIIKYSN